MPPVWFSFIAFELLLLVIHATHALHYHSSGFFIIMSPAEGLHFSALVIPFLHNYAHTDDESEIGDESEEDKWKWGKRGKKHPRSVAPRGWISKRRKIDRLIKECDSLVRATPVSYLVHSALQFLYIAGNFRGVTFS